MRTYDTIRTIIKRTLNDCFIDYNIRTCTKGYLLEMAEGDLESVDTMLTEWESKGYIRKVTPLESADKSDVCLEMLTLIENPFTGIW